MASKLMQLIQTKLEMSMQEGTFAVTEYWTPEGDLVDRVARQIAGPAPVAAPQKLRVAEKESVELGVK